MIVRVLGELLGGGAKRGAGAGGEGVGGRARFGYVQPAYCSGCLGMRARCLVALLMVVHAGVEDTSLLLGFLRRASDAGVRKEGRKIV